MRTSLWLSGLLVVAALTAAMFVALRPRPVHAEVATVTRGPFAATVTAEGRTRVKALYVVATPIDGELQRITVQPGDAVAAGEIVARISPLASRPLDLRSRTEANAVVVAARATVARAEATQKEAEAALTHAESERQTAARLAANGVAPTKVAEHAGHEADIRREAVAVARAAVESAMAELQRAEAAAANVRPTIGRPAATVVAPISGRILRVRHESAGAVSIGTPLLEIADTSSIEIVTDLLTADAMAVKPGSDAWIEDGTGQKALAARVRLVEPAAFTKVSALGLEEQRVRVVLDLADTQSASLGHDFRVNVSIVVWKGADVLAVPQTALFRTGESWAVFTVEGGRARMTAVVPGHSDRTRTAIEKGLTEGQKVVAQPSDLIGEGTVIEPES